MSKCKLCDASGENIMIDYKYDQKYFFCDSDLELAQNTCGLKFSNYYDTDCLYDVILLDTLKKEEAKCETIITP